MIKANGMNFSFYATSLGLSVRPARRIESLLYFCPERGQITSHIEIKGQAMQHIKCAQLCWYPEDIRNFILKLYLNITITFHYTFSILERVLLIVDCQFKTWRNVEVKKSPFATFRVVIELGKNLHCFLKQICKSLMQNRRF